MLALRAQAGSAAGAAQAASAAGAARAGASAAAAPTRVARVRVIIHQHTQPDDGAQRVHALVRAAAAHVTRRAAAAQSAAAGGRAGIARTHARTHAGHQPPHRRRVRTKERTCTAAPGACIVRTAAPCAAYQSAPGARPLGFAEVAKVDSCNQPGVQDGALQHTLDGRQARQLAVGLQACRAARRQLRACMRARPCPQHGTSCCAHTRVGTADVADVQRHVALHLLLVRDLLTTGCCLLAAGSRCCLLAASCLMGGYCSHREQAAPPSRAPGPLCGREGWRRRCEPPQPGVQLHAAPAACCAAHTEL